MQVIHATWLEAASARPSLFLWCEDGEALAAAVSSRARARRYVSRNALPHPFSAGAPSTHRALARLLDLPEEPALPSMQATLHLPSLASEASGGTAAGLPLPSPDLVRLPAEVAAQPELAPWSVSGCCLHASEAALLLAWLPAELPSGLRLGSTLPAWSAAARWALSLLLRQRILPDLLLVEGPPGAARPTERRRLAADREACGVARWIPALDDAHDRERLRILAGALPPAASCQEREGPSAEEVILRFVGAVVDELARYWASRLVSTDRPGTLHMVTARWPSAARAWGMALRAGTTEVTGPWSELSRLERDLRAWQRDLRPTGDRAPFRTGFRLEAPPSEPPSSTWNGPVPAREADGWTVHVFLQAVDEPEIRVEAREAWEAGEEPRSLGRHRLEHPRETLLADLGRALRVFPALERTLQGQPPTRCELGTWEASQFIRQTAWLLEESGFAVELPPWATDPAAGPHLQLIARDAAPSTCDEPPVFGLETLLSYEWRVALGPDVMDPRDFELLADTKIPLVRLREGWTVVEATRAGAMLDFWRDREGRPVTLRQALQLAAGADEAGGPAVDLALQGELACLDDVRRMPPLATPAGLQGELRGYQREGFSWLRFLTRRGLGACLADDMGLGKTIQLIAMLLHERDEGDGEGPTLLVCPTSLVGNWRRELARFAPSLRVMVHHGSGRQGGEAFEETVGRHDVVLTTYGVVSRDTGLRNERWRGVVLDEAQNIKNAEARQARAVRGLQAGYHVAMTGTPVENRLLDLWSIMDFLNPGLLGSAEAFRRRFAVPIERYQNEERRGRLRRAVQPFLLRRVKTDPSIISDLPEKREMKVFCTLSREQASLYEATVREMLERIGASDGIARRGLVLSAMMRLKQICNHPAHFLSDGSPLPGRSGKLARLEEMLEAVVASGQRALVFTQFREWALLLSSWLGERLGIEVPCLHGGTPRDERDRLVERFQASDGPPVFVLSLKAGGVGLNLTRSTNIFHFDRWWNPAVENQATDRAFRIGQKRDVQVYKFVCLGTLEEAVDRLLESKVDLAESVVGSGEAWLTELSMGELREMFTLRDACVEDED